MPNITTSNSVTPTTADLNDILTYNVVFQNTGSFTANNTLLNCSTPKGTEFVEGSFIINSVSKPNDSPILGYSLGDVVSGTTINIEFQMKIVSVIGISSVKNVCNFYYYYGKTLSSVSTNEAITQIQNATIVSTATVSEIEATVNTVLTYNISLKNEGSVNATNVIFKYILTDNLTFKSNSLTIDGVVNSGNPNVGINLNPIISNQTINISFQVTIEYLPIINPMENRAEITYEYTKTVQGSGNVTVKSTSNSNFVNTKVNYPYILVMETNNREVILSNTSILYAVNILNAGNIIAKNVNFKSILSNRSTFKAGSVSINGVSKPTYDIITGFSLGNIDAQSTVIINFIVDISYSSSVPFITGESTITALFSVISSQPDKSYEFKSNLLTTQLDYAFVGVQFPPAALVTLISKQFVYSILVTAPGNTVYKGVIVKGIFPNEIGKISGHNASGTINFDEEQLKAGINVGDVDENLPMLLAVNATVIKEPPLSIDTIYIGTMVQGIYNSPPNIINQPFKGSANMTPIQIPKYRLTAHKTLSSNQLVINDIVKCFITVTNTGNFGATNVVVTNPLPDNLSFVPNSIIINSTPNSPGDPNTGINLGAIPIRETVGVTFDAKLIKPSIKPLISLATITGDFILTQGNNTPPTNKKFYSNITQLVMIDTNKVNIVASVNKTFAQLNDILEYTITIYNQGNTDINNINFKDTLPLELTFESNSVTINSVNKPGFVPSTGFNIGTILPQDSTVVFFKAQINSVPKNIIENMANITYEYTINKTNYSGSKVSNIAATGVVYNNVVVSKSSDITYVGLNSIITYTIHITNNGNVNVENGNFLDPLPSSLEFKNGSVKVDSVTNNTANPNNGFILNTILAGQDCIVEFQATMVSITALSMENKASIAYNYIVDPANPAIPVNIDTNIVTIYPLLILKVSSNFQYANLNKIITYTIVIKNNFNGAINNVNCTVNLTSNLSFVSGSLKVNTTSRNLNKQIIEQGDNYNKELLLNEMKEAIQKAIVPPVSIPSIPYQGTSTITFNAEVVNLVGDKATCEANVTCNGLTFKDETSTILRSANLQANKTSNKTYVGINDVVTYTIDITNNGNVDATNVTFKDTLPAGIQFKNGSVEVNGITNGSANPNSGFIIGTISATGPGKNSRVTFKVDVISTTIPIIENKASIYYEYIENPSNNPVSVNIETNILNIYPLLLITVSSDSSYANLNKIIKYTVLIKNNSNAEVNNISCDINLTPNLSFISGSLQVINVIRKKSQTRSIPTINISSIPYQGTKTITFEAQVVNLTGNTAVCKADVTCNSLQFNGETSTILRSANLQAIKTVNNSYVGLNDIVTYSISITNNGNVNADNIWFKDAIPSGIKFETGTVKINGTINGKLNPNSGFALGNILPGVPYDIEFQAKVISQITSSIENKANISYEYIENPANKPITVSMTSNGINIYPLIILTISSDTKYASLGKVITYTVEIKNVSNAAINGLNSTIDLDANLSFIAGSLNTGITPFSINSNNKNLQMKNKAIPPPIVSNIPYKSILTITFKATVIGLIDGKGICKFTSKYGIGEFIAETVTNLKSVKLHVAKTVDNSYVCLNQVITYTILIANYGDADASNIYFKDVISEKFTFVSGSVQINGGYNKYFNPNEGFYINSINAGTHCEVKFKVKVTSIIIQPVFNKASISYEYIVDPLKPPISETVESNIVSVAFTLNIWIAANKEYANLNELITYTVTIRNNTSMELKDIICAIAISSNMEFVEGTLIINNESSSNTMLFSKNRDLVKNDVALLLSNVSEDNISIPIHYLDSHSIAKIIFKTKIINIINNVSICKAIANYREQNFSSEAVVILRQGTIVLKEYVSNEKVILDEPFTYTIIMKNEGNVLCNDLIFKSELQCNVEFVPESFTVDTVVKKNVDPTKGVNLDDLFQGDGRIITFQVKAISPKPILIQNQSYVSYKFTKYVNDTPISEIAYSNMVFCTIKGYQVTLTKMSNKKIANPGDIIVFTVVISNNDVKDALNIQFMDVLAENLEFIPNSFQLNENVIPKVDVKKGVLIGDIESLGYATIKFKVKVKYSVRPPRICNVAYATVYYKDVDGPLQFISNVCRVIIGPIKFYKIGLNKIKYLP